MVELEIIVGGDGCWPDLIEKLERGQLIHVTTGMQVASLEKGMTSGKPSVSIRIDLPDGRTIVSETSLNLFLKAAEIFKARYGGG